MVFQKFSHWRGGEGYTGKGTPGQRRDEAGVARNSLSWVAGAQGGKGKARPTSEDEGKMEAKRAWQSTKPGPGASQGIFFGRTGQRLGVLEEALVWVLRQMW